MDIEEWEEPILLTIPSIHEGDDYRIYPPNKGHNDYVISWEKLWQPGCYATEEAALWACHLDANGFADLATIWKTKMGASRPFLGSITEQDLRTSLAPDQAERLTYDNELTEIVTTSAGPVRYSLIRSARHDGWPWHMWFAEHNGDGLPGWFDNEETARWACHLHAHDLVNLVEVLAKDVLPKERDHPINSEQLRRRLKPNIHPIRKTPPGPSPAEVGELINRTAETIAEKALAATGISTEELVPAYGQARGAALAAIVGLIEHAADRDWTAAELFETWYTHCYDVDPVEH